MHFFSPPEYVAAFRSFLQSEFSEENIEFWLACEDFKSTGSSEDLSCKAKKIYEEFISSTACREVSLKAAAGLVVYGGKNHCSVVIYGL